MLRRAPSAFAGSLVLWALLPPATARAAPLDPEVAAAVRKGIERLLAMQEGKDRAEWPYEGVYRVGGEIPIGYRVGGTSIVGLALLLAPGYAEDPARQQALARAARFVASARKHPLMQFERIEATYDVRGWGYAYGLSFLLALERADALPDALAADAREAIAFFVHGLEDTAIPEAGGWNYARRNGFGRPGPPSPFMTGSSLQALFQARAQGYPVSEEVVAAGLLALERARTPAGGYVYAGTAARPEPVPGSVGRMLIAESTLFLAGRGSVDRVRGAVDAFFAHWEWLERRRAKTGTHARPFGVAPYYYFYAHYYAAQAIELLPAYERSVYRLMLRRILFQVRAEDGTWNDRVFPRSANYGTAMSVLALSQKALPPPARYVPAAANDPRDSSASGSQDPGPKNPSPNPKAPPGDLKKRF